MLGNTDIYFALYLTFLLVYVYSFFLVGLPNGVWAAIICRSSSNSVQTDFLFSLFVSLRDHQVFDPTTNIFRENLSEYYLLFGSV